MEATIREKAWSGIGMGRFFLFFLSSFACGVLQEIMSWPSKPYRNYAPQAPTRTSCWVMSSVRPMSCRWRKGTSSYGTRYSGICSPFCVEDGQVAPADGQYYYLGQTYPVAKINIRTGSEKAIHLRDAFRGNRFGLIEGRGVLHIPVFYPEPAAGID